MQKRRMYNPYEEMALEAHSSVTSRRALLGLRGAMMSGKSLPYDRAVEYLESSGTQYIDTGIEGVSGLKILFEFLPIYPVATNYQDYFGGSNGDNVYGYRVRNYSATKWSIGVAVGKIISYGYTVPDGDWVKFETDGAVAKINGTSIGSVGGSYNSNKLFLHAFCNNGNVYRRAKVRVRKFVVEGLADYVPCVKGGVACYYDNVSKTFKYNAGTGDFILPE